MHEVLLHSKQFNTLPYFERLFILNVIEEFRLTFQQSRFLIETATDLQLWEAGSLSDFWEAEGTDHLTGRDRGRLMINRLRKRITALRSEPIEYTDELVGIDPRDHVSLNYLTRDTTAPILGSCPVAGERTRCCNLLTLDAVEQCGYGCSYCSIQTFYDNGNIYFHANLAERLAALELDPDTLYHIGTGQSSDSLLWQNRNNLLGDLFTFAERHPNVILELKTKSAAAEWSSNLAVPGNVIATWSLNTPTVIRHEEHRTATLEQRLEAARKVADNGVLVGFHFHPIVYFRGWEEEYARIVRKIEATFSVGEVVMVSLGTLTFIKPVMKKLRESGIRSKVLKIPLSDAAGKYSYPMEIKEQLFSAVYGNFSAEWQQEVFFYLCMEPHSLWKTVLNREYKSNEEFENSMKSFYMHKIKLAR